MIVDQRRLLVLAGVPRRRDDGRAAAPAATPGQSAAGRGVVVLPSEDVVPGDVIFLSAGDDVPADCRLVEAFGVRVNNATVTGEARPVSRDARRLRPTTTCCGAGTSLLAGTSVTTGEAKALVFATGMHTAFGRIARLTQTTIDAPSPLQKEIAALSRVIAALAVAIGAGRVRDRPVHRPADARQPRLRDRHHRRERAGRAAADRDAGDGDGRAAHGAAAHARASPAERRDARVARR